MKKAILFSSALILIVSLSAFQPKKPKKPVKKKTSTEQSATPTKNAPKVVLSDKAFEYKLDKTFHDFGKANEGDQVTTAYTLTNTGKEPIIIQNHTVECGCTTPDYPKEPIMPGKSAKINVGFNTAGKLGTNNKKVTLTTNGGSIELTFKCEVTEKAKVDPIAPGIIIKPNNN
jgi:hypothetical protein